MQRMWLGWQLLFAALILIATLEIASALRLPAPVVWASERGVLQVTTLTGNGQFAGLYDTRKPDFGCVGLFEAAGKVAYNRVVFSVNFHECGTLVQWSGTVHGSVLTAKWTLIYSDPITGIRKFRTGNDVLTRLP